MNTTTASGVSFNNGLARPSLPGRAAQAVMAVLRHVVELPSRRAAFNELSALSDYELADIGLARSDIRRVYEPSFAATRARSRFVG